MWVQSISELTGELNKVKEELHKTKEGLKQVEARQTWMVSVAVDEIKANVDAWIAQACQEAVSDTYSRFLYTLCLNHPEMDFSFFGDEVIKEVK